MQDVHLPGMNGWFITFTYTRWKEEDYLCNSQNVESSFLKEASQF